jgi:hypothetical protein
MYVHDDGSIADEAKASVGKLLLPFGAHGKSLIITGWLSLSLSLFLHHLLLSPLHYIPRKRKKKKKGKRRWSWIRSRLVPVLLIIVSITERDN